MELFSKSKDIFVSNFNKICRTCIKTKTEPLHQIFDSEVIILNERIRTCELLIAVSTLKIHPDDDLPKGMCFQCLDSMTKAYNFQKMCILSDLCMRSAVLPQINSAEAPLSNNTNKVQDQSNIHILHNRQFNTVIENVVHSEKNISGSIMQSEILPSDDINGFKLLLMPAENDPTHNSGPSIIISDDVSSGIQIFPSEPQPAVHKDSLKGSSLIIPNEIKTDMNIFHIEPLTTSQTDKTIVLESYIKTSKLSNDPHANFDVSVGDIPPWKRGKNFEPNVIVDDPCVQSVTVPGRSKSIINSFTLETLPKKHIDVLDIINVTDLRLDSANISIEEKSIDEMSTGNEKRSIFQNNSEKNSNILLAYSISLEGEIDHSHKTNSPTSNDNAGKSTVSVDVEDLIETNFVENVVIQKEKPVPNPSESEEPRIASVHTKKTEENLDNETGIPDTDIHKTARPNRRCEKMFNNEFRIHRPRECEIFNKQSTKKELIASHKLNNQNDIDGTTKFQCKICLKLFKSLNSLTRHKQLHEGSKKVDHQSMHIGTKSHVCEYCQKSFQQASLLKNHLRTHTGEQPFLCAECGRAFNNASNLRQHQLRHSGIKSYQCPECPSKFASKGGLFSHKATHSNQKPYECCTCGSRFTKNFSLKKHQRIHTGEKPFKCDHCEMRFNSSDHMKRHMRTHTGEKPFKCKYCERKFTQSNDLMKHLQSHLGENVYKCEECDASFRLSVELKKHVSEHYKAQTKDKTNKYTA
ncbi:zinc finger protein 23-like [Episyrphus balteatus]|uniref:zinc finger protein 23-like n=1 Tax=Episyrphus balteatus TaxID=286459 RepID=UPI002484D95D|nr:zinc finger protein 23-like [Episyrphus balteatus]